MDRDTKLIIIILFTVAFSVVYNLPPKAKEQNQSGIINIVVISTSDEDYTKYEYLTTLAQKHLNTICNETGIDEKFKFSVYSGEAKISKPLEIIIEQHKLGRELFIGGGRSDQLFALRTFINDNNILIVSPSSTNPQEAMLQDDYIFRMSIHDFMIGSIVARTASSIGVDKMLIIGRKDAWGEGLGDWFEKEFESLDGETVGRVSYAAESTELTRYLDEAELILEHEVQKSPNATTGILLLAFKEASIILDELKNYPYLSNAIWFGTDKIANSLEISFDIIIGAQAGLISPLPLPVWNNKTSAVGLEYQRNVGEYLDFYDGNIYDACMLLGLSVIEADSVNASIVKEVIIDVSQDYEGLTGLCGLDENGDRWDYMSGLYGLGNDPDLRWMLYGKYVSNGKKVIWEDIDLFNGLLGSSDEVDS